MARDLASITARFHSVASKILSAPELAAHPYFYRYRDAVGDLDGAGRYVRYQTDLLDLAGVSAEDAVVIDAGCGFGFTLIVYALLGAEHVRGIEINPDMVTTIESFLPLLPAEISARISVCRGDVASMPYEPASANIVLSIEAISHYLDVDAFMDQAQRVLRDGGVLIIADGNNGSNPIVRRRTHEIWEAVECGGGDAKLHGHAYGLPYVEVRRHTLDERFPALASNTRAEIARRTAGYTEEQLIEAVRDHVETGALPSSVYRRRQLAIAPDGTAMERLFSPRGLARDLRDRGFEARAHGYWGGAGGTFAVRTANAILSVLSPLTIPFAPSFRVIARKPSGSPR